MIVLNSIISIIDDNFACMQLQCFHNCITYNIVKHHYCIFYILLSDYILAAIFFSNSICATDHTCNNNIVSVNGKYPSVAVST